MAAAALIGAVAMLPLNAPHATAIALVVTGVPETYTVSHGESLSVAAPGVLGNDLDLLGGTTATLLNDASHGVLVLNSNGRFTYQPDQGYVGSDTFRYRPDALLLGVPAWVTINVTNKAPVARNDSYTWAGGKLTINAPGVLGNDTDADGDVLTAAMVGGGVSGSLDFDSNGGFELDPGGGFGSSESFQYRVWDGRLWSNTVTVTLTITAATPTPTPTPRPTPRPTPKPTPSPTPRPTLPLPSLPLPSLPLPSFPGLLPMPRPTPVPTQPVGEPTPRPTPVASVEPERSPDNSTTPPGPGALPPAGGPGTAIGSDGLIPPSFALHGPSSDEIGLGLGGGGLDLVSGLDTWAVPAAAISGVGLLVLLFAGLQGGATLTWVPAVRRLRGERTDRRRVRVRVR